MAQYVQVLADFPDSPPPRIQALRWALQAYVSAATRGNYGQFVRSQHVDGSVTSFASGDPKCNKLVADAYAHGAGAGTSVAPTWGQEAVSGRGWPVKESEGNFWPPQSTHLADRGLNLRSLTNARPLRDPGDDKAKPELGDIIAFPPVERVGHTGLYLGRNVIVAAKEEGIELETIESEQAAHGGVVVIRKFNGSGQ